MRVLLLPPDRVEEGAELRQTFELYRCHLLLAIQYIIDQLVNVHGLLLLLSKVNHSSPPKVLEGQLDVLVLHWLGIVSKTNFSIFFRLLALGLA